MSQNNVIFDCETYPNYFCCAFYNPAKDKKRLVEMKDKQTLSKEDRLLILTLIKRHYSFIGFNCLNFDVPVLRYALQDGINANDVYVMATDIIANGLKAFQTEEKYSINTRWSSNTHVIDLFNVAPGIKESLKKYGARIHTSMLQDLPYSPETRLTNGQIKEVTKYCFNDVKVTYELYQYLQNEILLRENMSKEYNLNLHAKTDAQIAEAIFKKELNLTRFKHLLKLTQLEPLIMPDFLKGKFKVLDSLINEIENTPIPISDSGSPQIPESLQRELQLDNKLYKLGIGGIHSVDASGYYENLIDVDVTSYYPSIIVNNGYAPKHLGDKFFLLYKNIINKRIEAKKTGDKTISDSLKIVINGTYGKLGSHYSTLYAPDMMLQVTFVGQLSLILLILMMIEKGISVVSANTDGILLQKHKEIESVCKNWEDVTQFNLESTHYIKACFRDVNNYFAVTSTGGVKTKGIFETKTLRKNPHFDCIVKAVMSGDIENTIRNAPIQDLVKCVTVRGGAQYKDNYLGKVVRFVWVKEGAPITYVKSGNKVPESDNCLPVMNYNKINLEKLDIDYDRYIQEACKLKEELR